ncbi:hypothetical protein EYF80_024266 [Liparis tanakae]|uniref:Uncharacterized protein n=1 Tax=Liparis tanakae TaxID=230148 RepID=A0A4Z2HHY5_9TELE|nr:hypothetical protein EYF80_024266 [Liparis tanakae]
MEFEEAAGPESTNNQKMVSGGVPPSSRPAGLVLEDKALRYYYRPVHSGLGAVAAARDAMRAEGSATSSLREEEEDESSTAAGWDLNLLPASARRLNGDEPPPPASGPAAAPQI